MFFFFIFFFFAMLFFVLNFLFSYKLNFLGKINMFECGFDSLYKIFVSFSIHFFFIMLIFIIFDLEILFLFGFLVSDKVFFFCFFFIMIFVIGGLYIEWFLSKLVWSF